MSTYIMNLYQTAVDDLEMGIKEEASQQEGESEENLIDFFDYGKGINIKRLWRNRIDYVKSPEEEEKKESEWEDDEEDSVFKNYDLQFEDDDDYRIFSHSNANDLIKEALNFNYSHKKVTFFKYFSFLWFGIILLITGNFFFFF